MAERFSAVAAVAWGVSAHRVSIGDQSPVPRSALDWPTPEKRDDLNGSMQQQLQNRPAAAFRRLVVRERRCEGNPVLFRSE